MDISLLSDHYLVRRMQADDIAKIYALCKENCLYYHYCPPYVSIDSIARDLKALPPHKDYDDKYYLGYYDEEKLIAVIDLILAYPDKDTAFIGFFMVDRSQQNAGIGSMIIDELCACLKDIGFSGIRLGWVNGNPQAEHFWHKNSFVETGISYDTADYTVILAQRQL